MGVQILFGRRRKKELVEITGRLAVAGLVVLTAALAALAAVVVFVWVVVPFRARRRPDRPQDRS